MPRLAAPLAAPELYPKAAVGLTHARGARYTVEMNAPAPPPGNPQPADAAGAAVPPAAPPAQGHGLAYTVIVVFLLGLAFGAWGLWKVFAPGPRDAGARLGDQAARIDRLQQQVANLTRSDDISRKANSALQGTLAERDEEIAGLKADVAFYERFVGATSQRRGLAVHELKLVAQDAQTWHFVATLTQNLSRGAVNAGRATLAVEGTRAGRMQQLDWATLRQQPAAPGVEYSFKYFQQVEGDLLLPAGFKPVRVMVRLAPQRGAVAEQSFTWADATGAQGSGRN